MPEKSLAKQFVEVATIPIGGEAYREARERGESRFKATIEAAYQALLPSVHAVRRKEREGQDVTTTEAYGALAYDVGTLSTFAVLVASGGTEGAILGTVLKLASNTVVLPSRRESHE